MNNERPKWHERALCAQVGADAWFPEKGAGTREPKRICQMCEVRMDCLTEAFRQDERFGVWGGLSERDRRKLKHLLAVAGDDQTEVERILTAGMAAADAKWLAKFDEPDHLRQLHSVQEAA